MNPTNNDIEIFSTKHSFSYLPEEIQNRVGEIYNFEKRICEDEDTSIEKTESSWIKNDYFWHVSKESDIFSELNESIFKGTDNPQMTNIMMKFRNHFYKTIQNVKTDLVLPKFHHYVDEDSADLIRLSSNLTDRNMILYLSFEKNAKDSSYGILWNDFEQKKNETRNGSLYEADTSLIFNEICLFLFNFFV